jgi:predicted nicotinamide N-methyase
MEVRDQSFPDTTAPGEVCSHALMRRRLEQSFDVIEDEIAIGERLLSVTRIRDTNQLLESITPDTFAVDERLPYWAELWPSSLALAARCYEMGDLRGHAVLEVGCGLGIAGVAALQCGASVLFTDYETDALAFARCNALGNLPEGDVCARAEFRVLDWRAADTPSPADVILAADVIYEKRNHEPLLQLTRATLKRDGVAIFTDPDRSTCMPFFALAERSGFSVTLGSRTQLHARRQTTVLLGELRHRNPHA